MTIAFVASSLNSTATNVRGTTSINVAWHSVSAGRIAIVTAEAKLIATTSWGTVTGFTQLLNVTGGGGTVGTADQGTTRLGVWYKVLDGTETGNVTVPVTNGAQVTATLSVYSKTLTSWVPPIAVSGNDSSHGTGISAAMGAWPVALFPGDMLVFAYARNTDSTGALSSVASTQSGATFGSMSAIRSRMGGSDGTDGSILTWDRTVTTGSANALTFTATDANSSSGPVAAIRLREANSAAISTLTDDFDDNTINTSVWSQNYGVTSETGGRARVETSTTYAAYMTIYGYSLDSTGVYFRAYPAAINGATTEAYTATWLTSGAQPSGTDFGFYYEATTGVLNLTIRTAFSQDGSTVNLTYDSTDHAYWRIRLSGGNILWDTSPDGSTWTNRRTATAPAYAASTVDFALQLESHRAEGTPNFAEFDNLNVSPVTVVSGAAVLTGQSNLVTSGTVTKLATSVLTGQSNLVSSATITKLASAVLTGQSNMVTVSVVQTRGVATLSAQSNLTAVGNIVQLGSAVLTGQSSLVTSGTVSKVAATQLSTQSSLTVVGRVMTTGATTLTGQTVLNVMGTPTRFGVAALSGQTSLTTSGTLTRFGAAVMTAQTSMNVEASTTTVTNASLAAQSNLIVSATVTTRGVAVLTAQSNMVTVAGNTVRATTVLTGQSNLSTIGQNTVRAISALTAQSNLAVVPVITTTGSVILTGQSTLTAVGNIGALPASVAMTSQSNLSTIGQNTVRAISVQSAQTSLIVSATVTVRAATTLTAQSNLNTVPLVTKHAISMLSAQSQMTVVGNAVLGPVQSVLSAQSNLVVSASVIRIGSANLSANSSIAVSSTVTTTGVAVLSQNSILSAIGVREVRGTIVLSAQSTLLSAGFIPAVVTGLVQLTAGLISVIEGHTSPPWVFPFIEFGETGTVRVVIMEASPSRESGGNSTDTTEGTEVSENVIMSMEGG